MAQGSGEGPSPSQPIPRSESSLQVALHPLVLLTISDYITRHTLRQQKGPIVGALLGQQDGRTVTIEHAFECLLKVNEANGDTELDGWFDDRLQQMRDVHKQPPLDLVGWYTLIPTTGPTAIHHPIHRQLLERYNDSTLLLGFHPSEIQASESTGKLPLTIYDSTYETEGAATNNGGAGGDSEDREMTDGDGKMRLRFAQLPYTVETGEAEMISVDFVARGGGNATAVDREVAAAAAANSSREIRPHGIPPEVKDAKTSGDTASPDLDELSREEEEYITSLTAKANAVKMLRARIDLIATYLRSPPTSSSTEAGTGPALPSPDSESILRSIQALLCRLSLLIPADHAAYGQELLAEQNDVSLVSLLSTLTESVKDVRGLGKKFAVVDVAKRESKKESASARAGMEGRGEVSGAGDLMSY